MQTGQTLFPASSFIWFIYSGSRGWVCRVSRAATASPVTRGARSLLGGSRGAGTALRGYTGSVSGGENSDMGWKRYRCSQKAEETEKVGRRVEGPEGSLTFCNSVITIAFERKFP